MKFELLIFVLLYAGRGVWGLDVSWWKHTIMHEIFVWSFKDSNGDGIGDMKGITTMLDHFNDLGIQALYLTPFFESPMKDSGYDITNFTAIDSLSGTMEDFEELIREMKRRRMKLVIDLVINHSSDEHEWFQKSIDEIPPYKDFYIWKDPKGYNADGTPNPPNNWLSVFGGSAWTWNEKRKQFYYHLFVGNQPDFNLRNKALKEELIKVVKFWIDKGVAGMRLDAANHFVEDELFRDEPLVSMANTKTSSDIYDDYQHIYTTDHNDTYAFIHELREFVDQYSRKKNDFERIFLAEVYSPINATMRYYGTEDYPVPQFPLNLKFISDFQKFENANVFSDILHQWMDNLPKGAVPNWNVENHDHPRVGTRLNREYSDILLITMMMAPGIAVTYYGQEIGMTNHRVRKDQRTDQIDDHDPDDVTKDGQRLPMQWDDSMNAGFTSNQKSWLPVNTDYWSVNVENQNQKHRNTRYNLFKALSTLRKTKTLRYGIFKTYILSTWIFAFTRTYKNQDTYVVVHNLGSETEIVDLHLNIKKLPRCLEVVVSSLNSGHKKGTKIMSRPKFPDAFAMRPLSSVVLRTAYSCEENRHYIEASPNRRNVIEVDCNVGSTI